jgi:hypothetical protein
MRLLAPLVRGALAGTIGTLAMDLLWYRRYRREGGSEGFREWELTGDVQSWEDAPAPGQMGRKLIEAVSRRPLPVERAAQVTDVMHWTYGAAWTIAYSGLVRMLGRPRPSWHGPAFGAAVWGSDYITLPLAGIYEPIWRYDVAALYKDLSAHLVFGTVADAALRLPGA